MIAYVDSSVLLRVVLSQPDRLPEWPAIQKAVTSALTEVECLRTLDRRLQQGLLDPDDLADRRGLVLRLLERMDRVDVSAAVLRRAEGVPDVHILSLPPDAHRTINALQRAATVIVQKSVREGFGLVVTEGMWKGKPVVGGSVGGIRYQIVHDVTGYLVHSPEGCAFRVRQLLADPERARVMGQRAQESVRERYLLPAYIRNWLLVLLAMDRGPVPVTHL